jgi:two-component system LytT family response regulator
MMLRTFLVDDEPVALRRLAQTLHGIPGVELVGMAGDGISARRSIGEAAPDLVILDIEMPGCSGLDLAAMFSGEAGPEVVFLTAFGRYAAMAFDIEAADYLLKPVTVDRLNQAIRKVRRRLQSKRLESELKAALRPSRSEPDQDGRPNEVWVPMKTGEARVRADDIVWIEGAGDYVVIHTAVRSHLFRATMNSMEAFFSPARVRRVHRSSMVNMAMVEQIRRTGRGGLSLLLQDGVEVAIGPSYNAGVVATLKSAQPG